MEWTPGMTLNDMERLVIQKAYQMFQHNKTRTAQALGIAINTLNSKLEQYEQREKDLGNTLAMHLAKNKAETDALRNKFPQVQPFTHAKQQSDSNAKPQVQATANSALNRMDLQPFNQTPPQPTVSVRESGEVQEMPRPESKPDHTDLRKAARAKHKSSDGPEPK